MQSHKKMGGHKWQSLAVMSLLSFLAMYILMYLMVDKLPNVIPNLNQFYMAAVMTSAMVLIEIAVMKSMHDKKVVLFAAGLGVAGLILFTAAIRSQAAISDKEFLKSMIPHHAAALLMCESAKISDPEIIKLCQDIISSQQEQIDWMQAKLSASK